MIPLKERIISTMLYILPWSDVVPYGSYIYSNFPIFELLALPRIPILIVQQNLPFGDFLIFLILFLGVAKNYKIPYFIRFNTMQILLLKLGLIIFNYGYILLIRVNINSAIGDFLETIIFVGTLTIILFAITQCSRGFKPDIPIVSEAAEMQI